MDILITIYTCNKHKIEIKNKEQKYKVSTKSIQRSTHAIEGNSIIRDIYNFKLLFKTYF